MISDALARALLELGEDRPTRLVYGTATAYNTVAVFGASTAVELPAITPVHTGDYCAIVECGADRLILGPVAETRSLRTYVPTLTGVDEGTGGTNTATYSYSAGRLTVDGEIVFGSSGQTFPTSPTISLPSGFSISAVNNLRPIGSARLADLSTPANDRFARVRTVSPTAIGFLMNGEAGSVATITTTTPFSWDTGDGIYFHAELQGSF